MTRDKQIIAKLKELLQIYKDHSGLSLSCKYAVAILESELTALESEPDNAEEISSSRHQEHDKDKPCLSCKYWNTHGTGYCLAVQLCWGYNAYEKKDAEERKTAEITSDIVYSMQQRFEPNPDTQFKQGMYSGYAFGLQDGYKFASQSLPDISDEEIKYNSKLHYDFDNLKARLHFQDGAKWYRNELKKRL